MNSHDESLVPWDYWMNDWPSESIVWTRANLKDQAPRPLTPLTQDLIQTFEPEGMIKAFSDVFGIIDREQLGRHITGFYGALYLSVPNSAILGDATPGSSAHIKFEQFFGLTRAPEWEPPPPVRTSHEEAARKERFEAEIERVAEIVPSAIEKLMDAVVACRPAGGLAAVPWERLEEWLQGLDALQADCFSLLVEGANVASLAYAKVGAALTQRGLDPDGSLLTALHVGLGGNNSADMGTAVLALARAGQEDREGLAALIASGGVSDGTGDSLVMRLYDDFMRLYGHRGPGELMLERNSWRADPVALLRLVERGAGEVTAVRDAKGDAWEELTRRCDGAVPPDLDELVRYSQSVMAMRENAKGPIVKLFDEVRVLVASTGARLVSSGQLAATDDLLFCSLPELHRVLVEQAVPSRAEISKRRAAYSRCLQLDLPELVESLPDGVLRRPRSEYFVSLGFLPPTEHDQSRPQERGDASATRLSGIGAAPGVAEGKARVMSDAFDDFEPGDVLIAETVDPGWSPVLAAASAVILDIGGRLSHGAVVARELGVPCVVNTKIAGKAFANGQRVRVDGGAGTVEAV